jgi:heat shock protein HslJ
MRLFPYCVALLAVTSAVSCQNLPIKQTEQAGTAMARRAPDASLRETHWVLRQLGAQKVTVPEATSEAFLTLRADGKAEGNAGCNRFRGTFLSETPGELKFGPLMTTRMSCPAIETENGFSRALRETLTYRVEGDTLFLQDGAHAALARLEAVYLH